MTAARPLALDDFDAFILDDAHLATLPPEIRRRIEAEDARVTAADFDPGPTVPHEKIVAHIERQRVEALTAEGVDPFDMSPAGLAAQHAAEQRIRARLA